MSGEKPQRRLILFMSTSLDGFADAERLVPVPRAFDDHRQRAVVELLGRAGLLVLGARSYEDMAQAWPGSSSAVGGYMNRLPKIAFSQAPLPEVEWSNARVSDRPVEEEIPERKREEGEDIVVFGGIRFARSLAAAGLIDEYRLNVHPIALGEGRSLLGGLPEPLPLRLVSSAAWADGVVTHTYAPDS